MTEAAFSSAAPRRLRCAVVGVGKMGSLHAQKYAALADWELVAVADIDAEAAARVAHSANTAPLADYRELLGAVDAASIAVPTPMHHRVARDFLAAGCHVLIEKPITVTVGEADELIALARKMRRVLQVGHLERFNPAVMAIDAERARPRFIEATRIAPYSGRGTEVSVVLDLMIHDIDLILDIVGAEVQRIAAVGAPVFTGDIDIANARLVFADGCVANVTASRASQKVERKMRLFLPDRYLSIDLLNRSVQRVQVAPASAGPPQLLSETMQFDAGDALAEQIRCFGRCIRSGERPPTSGEAARSALALAARIGRQLAQGGRRDDRGTHG